MSTSDVGRPGYCEHGNDIHGRSCGNCDAATIDALHAEVETLSRGLADLNAATVEVERARDEARASLARVERERTHALEMMNLAHKGRDEALAECARLRAEGAEREEEAWNLALRAVIDLLRPEIGHSINSGHLVSVGLLRRWHRSPSPATGPAPEQRYCNKCGVLYIGPAEHAGCNYHAPIIHHHNPLPAVPRPSAEDGALRLPPVGGWRCDKCGTVLIRESSVANGRCTDCLVTYGRSPSTAANTGNEVDRG